MAGFTKAQIDGLGDFGVVGVLTFDTVVRGDTDSYTCTATNFLPETTVLSTVSDPVLLLVLGECMCMCMCVCYSLYCMARKYIVQTGVYPYYSS